MISTETLIEKILEIGDSDILTDKQKHDIACQRLSFFLDDVFKMTKNINTTSLNESDRSGRFIELEKRFGIPKTHLI
jgi:hypothetical protein